MHPGSACQMYHQHSADVLDLDETPLNFMRKRFATRETLLKEWNLPRNEEHWRQFLTQFGSSTLGSRRAQRAHVEFTQRIEARVCDAGDEADTLLLLDEPTNHLDLDAVSGLAKAIKSFEGGVVLVSHDFRLIDQVADEIWVCENPRE